MKKFISGLLIGILITLSITAFASELNILPNPYPVLVNGQKAEVDGYNINDSTYLKLTDFKKAGLDVNYNKAKKQIEITSAQAQLFTEGGFTVDQENIKNNTSSIPRVTAPTNTSVDVPVTDINLTGQDVTPNK